jgi:hypothetical protein
MSLDSKPLRLLAVRDLVAALLLAAWRVVCLAVNFVRRKFMSLRSKPVAFGRQSTSAGLLPKS